MSDSIIKELQGFESISEAFLANCNKLPSAKFFEQAQVQGDLRSWSSVNRQEIASKVLRIAGYLRSQGIGQGDKVAIVSSSRPEWVIADLAVLCLGAVVVSVYPSLSAQEVGYILNDSEVKLVFIENREQFEKLRSLNAAPCRIPATEDRAESTVQLNIKNIVCFDRVAAEVEVFSFESALSAQAELGIDTLPKIRREDLASLVYTSGTTGPPKGVMQTHGNHLANVRQAISSGLVSERMSIMVFLPLAHSFAKLMAYIGCLADVSLKFPAVVDRLTSKMNADSVTRDIREGGANVLPIVPRILEKMQEGIEHAALEKGAKAYLLRTTLDAASKVYNREAGIVKQLIFALTTVVRRSIKERLFGKGFRYAVSGGAKLNPDTCRFFDMLQIEVLEGYGLTETCVATNANRLGRKRIGTVGPVLSSDISVKIAEDGEILFKGPNITSGYYQRALATKAAWDNEGWFHTGDLGQIDEDGFLKIVGRKKELLVTSYGKKVAPEEVENRIKKSPFINQVVLLGDNRAYCAALLNLNKPAIREWAKAQGVSLESELGSTKAVVELISEEIERANQSLANFEQVKRFKILALEFTTENGLLTPTFKIKRGEINKQFAAEILELYN